MKILCLLILLICLISAIAAGLHKRILPRPTSHPGKTERPERTRATTVPINRGSITESNKVLTELSRSKRSGGSEVGKSDPLSKLEDILEHLRKFVHKIKSSGENKKHLSSTTKLPNQSINEVRRSKRSNENDYIKSLNHNLLNQLLLENEERLHQMKLQIISNIG